MKELVKEIGGRVQGEIADAVREEMSMGETFSLMAYLADNADEETIKAEKVFKIAYWIREAYIRGVLFGLECCQKDSIERRSAEILKEIKRPPQRCRDSKERKPTW